MRKYRLMTMLLIAALLFTPTVILIVRSASVGSFPEIDEVERIEIETAKNSAPISLDSTDPLFSTIFDIFDRLTRVSSSDIPSSCRTFNAKLFTDDRESEEIVFYVSEKNYSLYVRNSEHRYFALPVPELDILDTVLTPSKIELVSSDDNSVILSYPNASISGDDLVAMEIALSRWEKLENIVSTLEPLSASFTLYERKNQNEGYTLIGEVDHAASIVSRDPDLVMYAVRWELFESVDLVHYYCFVLGND